jgi:hypothetical protein
MGRKIWTGNTARGAIGVGAVVNPHHEGSTKSRPTEGMAKMDKFSPPLGKRKSIADFFRERAERVAAERAANNSGERE